MNTVTLSVVRAQIGDNQSQVNREESNNNKKRGTLWGQRSTLEWDGRTRNAVVFLSQTSTDTHQKVTPSCHSYGTRDAPYAIITTLTLGSWSRGLAFSLVIHLLRVVSKEKVKPQRPER